MIIALELYRGDNGKYPFEGSGYSYGLTNNNQITGNYNINLYGLFSPNYLSKYMKTSPKVPANSYTQNSNAWMYASNPNGRWKCVGDSNSSKPKQMIWIWASNPLLYNAFPELNFLQVDYGLNNNWETLITKCLPIY